MVPNSDVYCTSNINNSKETKYLILTHCHFSNNYEFMYMYISPHVIHITMNIRVTYNKNATTTFREGSNYYYYHF